MLEIEGSIPKDLYRNLETRKQLAHLEDETIRNKEIKGMLHVVSIQEKERIIKELKPLLRTKARLLKIMARKYDEVIEDTQKVLDQILMSDMPKKSSPPKATKPTSLGMGESSKTIEDIIKARDVDMQPDLFVFGVPVALDTSLDVNDLFQGNLDSVMSVKEEEQIEEK